MGESERPPASSACFTVEIDYADDTVAGQVTRAGSTAPERFGSWLDLLRLLEAPDHEETTTPTGSRIGERPSRPPD